MNLFISRFSSFPLFVRVLIIVLLFSVIGVFEICIYIGIGRLAALYQKTREANLKDRIIVMLANVLVYSDNGEPHTIVSHFLPRFSRLPLYRGTIRKLLVSELLKSHSSLMAELRESYKNFIYS